MTMKTDDLRGLYRAYVRGQEPSRKGRCLGPWRWKDICDPRTSEARKDKLIEHITRCPDCLRKFELILDAERAKKALVEEIGGLVGRAAGPGDAGPQKEESARERPHRRPAFPWKFAAVFAALVVMAAGLALVLTRDRGVPAATEITRGDQGLEIRLLRPIDAVKRRSGLEFAWTASIPLADFRIDLYDEALAPLWRSSSLAESRGTLPTEVFNALQNGKIYVWMASGRLPSGRRVESRFGTFRLAK
jgi:hypothetical protein